MYKCLDCKNVFDEPVTVREYNNIDGHIENLRHEQCPYCTGTFYKEFYPYDKDDEE